MTHAVAPSRTGRVPLAGVAVEVGVATSALHLVASWRQPLVGDEPATLSASTRSLAELGTMVTHVDAVHALYYAAVHVFVLAGGSGTGILRLPSVLASGIAAAGLVVLVSLLADTRTAILSGCVFAALPQVCAFAVLARSAALVTAAAMWCTAALVAALVRGARAHWIGYAALAALCVALSVYGALLLLGQLVAVALVCRWRTRFLRVGVICAAAVALAGPVIVLTLSQSRQVAWIPPLSTGTLRQLVEHQWFGDCWAVAIAAWLLVLVGVLVPRLRRGRTDLLVLSACCAAIPCLVLVAVSVVHPVYVPRYVAFTLPLVAALIAAPLGRMPGRSAPLATAALALLALPAYLAPRLPQVTEADVAAARVAIGRIVPTGGAIDLRDLELRVVDAGVLRGRIDVDLLERRGPAATLWDRLVDPDTAADRSPERLTVITRAADWSATNDGRAYAARGFTVARQRRTADVMVLELTRSLR